MSLRNIPVVGTLFGTMETIIAMVVGGAAAALLMALFYHGFLFVPGVIDRAVASATADLVERSKLAALQQILDAERQTRRQLDRAVEAERQARAALETAIVEASEQQKALQDEIDDILSAPPAVDCRVDDAFVDRLRRRGLAPAD